MTPPPSARDPGSLRDGAPSGLATERGNAAAPTEVGAMFDRISGVYDPLNLVISAFQEPRWRRRAVAAAALGPGGRAIDIATGTGKVAADLRRSPARRRGAGGGHQSRDDRRRRSRGMRVSWDLRSSWATRWRCRPRTDASMRRRSRSGCATSPTTRGGSPRWPAWSDPAEASSASRLRGPGAVSLGSCAVVRPDRSPHRQGRRAGRRLCLPGAQRRSGYPAPERIAEVMREAGLVGVRWVGMSGGIVTIHVDRAAAGGGRVTPSRAGDRSPSAGQAGTPARSAGRPRVGDPSRGRFRVDRTVGAAPRHGSRPGISTRARERPASPGVAAGSGPS